METAPLHEQEPLVIKDRLARELLSALTSNMIDRMDSAGVPELAEKLRPVAYGTVESIELDDRYVSIAQKLANICIQREMQHEQGLASSGMLMALSRRAQSEHGLESVISLLLPVTARNVPKSDEQHFPMPSWGGVN